MSAAMTSFEPSSRATTKPHAPSAVDASTSVPRQRAKAPETPQPVTLEVSVVLPCLNEEETVAAVVDEALTGLRKSGLTGEVIVVDNGSVDRSAEVARARGARVISEPRRGYGSAYLAGLAEARGEFIVLADADGTYPLDDLDRLLRPLRAGNDLVLGSRLNPSMQAGAMRWSHRWIGNPILTGMLNLLFRAGVSDAHCGLRAIRRSALPPLDLQTTGMEFASEMVVKAAKRRLAIAEVPISYRVRGGVSKLAPYHDAWRHVRFLLVHSPTFLFFVPGGLLFAVGAVALAVLAPGPLNLFGRVWEIHTVIVASLLTLVGAQVIQLGVFARTFAVIYLQERDRMLEGLWSRMNLERGLAIGGAVLVAGFAVLAEIVTRWILNGFGELHQEHLTVLALTLIGLGVQFLFASFFLSILGLRRRPSTQEATSGEFSARRSLTL